MLSNVVLVQYTTLDPPAHPEQTQPYGEDAVYVGVPMQALDLGDPYWYSNAGAMTYANGPVIPGTTFSAEGILSGTPSAIAKYPRHIVAGNDAGVTSSEEEHFLDVVSGAPTQLKQYSNLVTYINSPVNIDLATGYWSSMFGAITYREVGLPGGLTLDVNTGRVTGTANSNTVAQVDIYAANVSDEAGPAEFQWSVIPEPPLEDTDGTGTKISINIGINI